jgi:hypothetical protein
MKQCEVLTSAVGHTWIVTYITVMAFEAGSSEHLGVPIAATDTQQAYWA